MHFASKANNTVAIKLLGEKMQEQNLDIEEITNQQTIGGETPLMKSATTGNLDTVKALKELHSNPLI